MYSTAAERRRINNWRNDVADCAAPVVIRSDNPSFQNGGPAPYQVHVDDGRPLTTVKTPSLSYEPTTVSRRPRQLARRPSSDHGYYPKRSGARASSRAATNRYSKNTSEYDRQDRYDKYDRRDSFSKQSNSLWSSLFPTNRSSRSRTVTHDRPSRRTQSPEYIYYKEDPNATVYSSRPRSYFASAQAPRKEYIVTRSGTKRGGDSRKDSFGLEDRTRLLEIRDRMREEVDKARQWQSAKTSRRRNYDRRSSYY